ncbi:hypothetical protein F5148DRAFT_1302373 [Russula earlei]|uniref:Uncharacterized protein n=1 Tax=Russula earlei TaxID=71964 RepID=A0ACC0UPG6_9AGAM|nr:hypothetical protein F5148DRAFT_1302373 [Russula earlei]
MPPPNLDLKAKRPLKTWIQNPPSHPRSIPSCPGVTLSRARPVLVQLHEPKCALLKRPFPISTTMSTDSSDKDDDGGGLPASSLVAPWEVLHGLADVAIQQAANASQCKHPFSLFHSYATVVGEWQSK